MPDTPLDGRHVARFGRFELDLRSGELSRQGARVRLQQKPLKILELLLERRGELVTRDELRQVLWPGDTFVDFDGGLNTAVGKLRAALGDSADHPRFVETVGRRGYRLIVPAEAAETAAEPVAAAAGAPATRRRPWLPVLLAGAAALAAVAAGVLWSRLPTPAAGAAIRSLAVLPLQNLSKEAQDEYFADGMTEALITELAGIRSLRVISRQSAMRYRSSSKSLPEIAKELGVDAVVEGSVVRSGDRVRVSAQLVRAPLEEHLWADSYERDLGNVLALQAEVAAAVAAEVRATLTAPERARLARTRSVDPEAYDLYLRGRYFFNRRWQDDPLRSISRSVEYLEQSVARDPQFALAQAALSEAYGPFSYWASIPPDVAQLRRRATALRALELDPDLESAHTALASILINDWDWPGSERSFQRALELNPNYTVARFWYALLLLRLERYEDALQQTELGLATDPFDPQLASNNAAALANLGRHEEAIARLRRALELDPESWGVRKTLAGIYLRFDRREEALAEFERIALREAMARVRAFQGDPAPLRAVLRELQQTGRTQYVSPVTLASVQATLGEKEEALALLEHAADIKAVGIVDAVSRARFNPALGSLTMGMEFDPLRSHPRFVAVRRRMRLEQ